MFGKKQKEFKTHSFNSRIDFIKEMKAAKKNMNKKQFAAYQQRIKENMFLGEYIKKAKARGDKVQINPNSPKLQKFVIG